MDGQLKYYVTQLYSYQNPTNEEELKIAIQIIRNFSKYLKETVNDEQQKQKCLGKLEYYRQSIISTFSDNLNIQSYGKKQYAIR